MAHQTSKNDLGVHVSFPLYIYTKAINNFFCLKTHNIVQTFKPIYSNLPKFSNFGQTIDATTWNNILIQAIWRSLAFQDRICVPLFSFVFSCFIFFVNSANSKKLFKKKILKILVNS